MVCFGRGCFGLNFVFGLSIWLGSVCEFVCGRVISYVELKVRMWTCDFVCGLGHTTQKNIQTGTQLGKKA